MPDLDASKGWFYNKSRGRIERHSAYVAAEIGTTERAFLKSCYLDREGKPAGYLLYRVVPSEMRRPDTRRVTVWPSLFVTHSMIAFLVKVERGGPRLEKLKTLHVEWFEQFKRQHVSEAPDQGLDETGGTPDVGGSEEDAIPPEEIVESSDDTENTTDPKPPVVFNREQETLTTSLAVAAAYGKKHKNVLRDIEAILKTGSNLSPSFVFRKAEYTGGNGEQRPMYEMNEEAFSLLVGGFTGAAALRFRIAYITEFKRMQAALRTGGATGNILDFRQQLSQLAAIVTSQATQTSIMMTAINSHKSEMAEFRTILTERNFSQNRADSFIAEGWETGTESITDFTRHIPGLTAQRMHQDLQTEGRIVQTVDRRWAVTPAAKAESPHLVINRTNLLVAGRNNTASIQRSVALTKEGIRHYSIVYRNLKGGLI